MHGGEPRRRTARRTRQGHSLIRACAVYDSRAHALLAAPLCACSRSRPRVLQNLEKAADRVAPVDEAAMEALPLLLTEVTLCAHRDRHHLPHLVHLGRDQPRRDGEHHPGLDLVDADLQRCGNGGVGELFVGVAERDEREQPHLARAVLHGQRMLRHERLRLGVASVGKELGVCATRHDLQHAVEGSELGVLLELLHHLELREFIASEELGAADG
mmetsp:Transcript_45444/g.119374  ORF Transcript_45444/g.119374 Transcript_45444/m.119374 type:complete len:215 (+) Transcript_45444:214-858(+)